MGKPIQETVAIRRWLPAVTSTCSSHSDTSCLSSYVRAQQRCGQRCRDNNESCNYESDPEPSFQQPTITLEDAVYWETPMGNPTFCSTPTCQPTRQGPSQGVRLQNKRPLTSGSTTLCPVPPAASPASCGRRHLNT